jgi:phosphocarrier protein HPr
MIQKTVTICNKLGLHARASAKFVNTASQYASEIHISRGERKVNGKSIMGIMMLAATKGTELMLHINGDDEKHALDALSTLVNEKFGEAY